MNDILFYAVTSAFIVGTLWVSLADDPFGFDKSEAKRIKEESDRMLAEMDKNLAERKSRK